MSVDCSLGKGREGQSEQNKAEPVRVQHLKRVVVDLTYLYSK